MDAKPAGSLWRVVPWVASKLAPLVTSGQRGTDRGLCSWFGGISRGENMGLNGLVHSCRMLWIWPWDAWLAGMVCDDASSRTGILLPHPLRILRLQPGHAGHGAMHPERILVVTRQGGGPVERRFCEHGRKPA